jgi:hypothetical protein
MYSALTLKLIVLDSGTWEDMLSYSDSQPRRDRVGQFIISGSPAAPDSAGWGRDVGWDKCSIKIYTSFSYQHPV